MKINIWGHLMDFTSWSMYLVDDLLALMEKDEVYLVYYIKKDTEPYLDITKYKVLGKLEGAKLNGINDLVGKIDLDIKMPDKLRKFLRQHRNTTHLNPVLIGGKLKYLKIEGKTLYRKPRKGQVGRYNRKYIELTV